MKRIKETILKHPRILFLVLDTSHRDTHRKLEKLIKYEDLILDVGARNSPHTAYFPNPTVVIDLPKKGRYGFSKEVLEELKIRGNLSAITASAEALPFRISSFNKIICTEVLEHIHDDVSTVSEMARVLKSEGKILLTTPNKDEIPLEFGRKEHVRHYTQKELRDLLSHFFREIVIEKRFRSWHFLSIQIAFRKHWVRKRLHMHFLVASLFSSWIYDVIYLLEKFQKSDNGGYNLVAICSKPLRDSRYRRELYNHFR